MKKKWTKWMGIVLAGSVLMGCGRQPAIGGAESLTAEGIAGSGAVQGQTGRAGDTMGPQQGQTGTAGDVMEPQQMQMADDGDWDREDDSHYAALQQFSYQLMLENMEEENPLLSPVSAYLALGMVGMGAQGETAQEFREILGSNMPAISQRLMERYPQEQEGIVLTIANSVWVDQQLTPKEQWIADMEEIFRGEGYRGVLSSQQVMDQINSWCSENTRGMIPKMLGKPLGKGTRLAVLDAVYFKGDWGVSFDPSDTVPRLFTKENGTQLQVDTMCMWGENQRYLHSELGEGVLLPYQGGDFAYVALLPEEGMQVREFYRQLTPEALGELLKSQSREFCDLCLPKYEVSFERELDECLQAMGLVRAFDGELADFSGLEETRQEGVLYISLVKQKAAFCVDEEGSEAAAVTMVVMSKNAVLEGPEPRELYFDRPFVYMILDLETQVPLFVGIMDDPG